MEEESRADGSKTLKDQLESMQQSFAKAKSEQGRSRGAARLEGSVAEQVKTEAAGMLPDDIAIDRKHFPPEIHGALEKICEPAMFAFASSCDLGAYERGHLATLRFSCSNTTRRVVVGRLAVIGQHCKEVAKTTSNATGWKPVLAKAV